MYLMIIMGSMTPLKTFALRNANLLSCLSIRLQSTHAFRKVIPWKNVNELANHLSKNVLYNEGGVVAINKPYGVGSSAKSATKQYLNAAPVGDHIFNLYDALPYLAKKIGHKKLFIGCVPERYTSGVTVLATTPFLQKTIKDCVQLSQISNDTMNQYCVVVVGSPNKSSGSLHLAIQMSAKVCNQPMLIPVTKTGLRKKKMHSLRAVYSTLSSSNLASLLAIRSSTARLNALRILCTDKLISPILGDNMFGARVKNMFGKVALVGFNEVTASQPSKLKTEVLEALDLTPGLELIIPTHLHLHEVYLAKFFNLDIVLRAPLPPVFQWSCEKLGLEVPECKPCEKLLRKDVLKEKCKNKDEPLEKGGELVEIGVATQ